ncbi:polyhydroxyalkanoate synthesis repressor PhaR [Aromatoleum diolicum]|uniref:Polyhydroxyalkanoate synthesis repressor PhaR n=1 Tax=Aromatoleum diolicum TaxID=75796 RepID=A0ABX1QBP0_9RHOO|nr:polyhydroxyalkanoate synthesis repressor PhaR [Aromatoleum diolicum]NMG74836.1 polyhydroxyalkanoate synthesis repressor PhaR [Aromatoleum diolicum]
MADQARLIKKYPNRRLYDTRTSSYITLADVKELVLAREDFQVVDAKTGEDLTRSILLQIILEEEAGGAPMFTSDLLAHMIRFYGNATQGMMGKYLENNIKAFTEMQAKLQEQAQAIYGENSPISQDLWAQFLNFQGPALQSVMGTYVDQSKKMFSQMQEQIESQTRNIFTGFPFPNYTPAGKDDHAAAAAPAPAPSAADKDDKADPAAATTKTSRATHK